MVEEFKEENSDFYDLEYFISLEYRYFSGAHSSRIKNILSLTGDLSGKKCLDLGCGGGFFANELQKRGAQVIGTDYSRFAIDFAKERFSGIDFRQDSVYDLENDFPAESFDCVFLLDVIEHVSDQQKVISQIKKILKPGGSLIVATDADDGPWTRGYMPFLIMQSMRFSQDGRAYRMIKKTEAHRKQKKDYHQSHISTISFSDLKKLLEKNGFQGQKHKIYPLVGVWWRDLLLKLLPKKFRGDHQCVLARKI